MKRILITGAGGFIGRNLCEKLKKHYEIYAPTREQLNLLDTEQVEKYLRIGSFDIVIHSANINDIKNRDVTDFALLTGNLRMFFNMERCRNYYGKMYYFGSGAEYDMNHYIPDMREEYFGTYIPEEPYSFSKYIMSKACSSANNIYDLRLFGVFGKYEEWQRRFISNAICRALKGMDITIQKNVYFDYLWIDDLCEIMQWFIENEPNHKHYNVCRGNKIDLYSLACMVRECLNINCDIMVAEKGWKPEYTGSNERLIKEIGNYQFTGFIESIENLCEYYKTVIDTIDERKLI